MHPHVRMSEFDVHLLGDYISKTHLSYGPLAYMPLESFNFKHRHFAWNTFLIIILIDTALTYQYSLMF